MTVDPAGDNEPEVPQSWNKYAYVRNNPLSHSDPTGTMGQDDVGGWGEATKQLANGPGIITVGEIGKSATFVKVAALAGALVAGICSGGPAAIPFLEVAATAGRVETGADLAEFANDRSPENLTKLGVDAIGAGGAKGVGYVLSQSGKTTIQAGEGIGEGIATIAAAAPPVLAPAIAASPGQAQRPPASAPGGPGSPTGASGGSGRGKKPVSSVDRKVQALKDRARKGPQ